ncbi:MAG: aminoglycoside/choline kinase family phosphotransferase [Limisphaerales bacterium]|jgi:aminoglycoside/choline kinase family phosphotransferase
MALPAMPQGITPAWLTPVLIQAGVLAHGIEVTQVSRSQVGDGVGMMSELARLEVNYSGATDAPRTLVAKFASQNVTNRAVAMDFHLYEREVRYFQELDTRTDLVSPHMYHLEMDGDCFVMLMEDLGHLRCGDQAEGADLEDSQRCVDALVKLHTPFWNKVDNIDWVPGVADSYHADTLYNFIQDAWLVMMEHFGEFVDPSIDQAREQFFSSARGLQANMFAAPRTFVHGDFRLDNFFFGEVEAEHEIVVFDFQGPLLGKGIVDVALLLGQSTKKEVRRAHERALVCRYAAGLRGHGIDYQDETAWNDYLDAILYSWLYTGVVAGTLDASNPKSYAWMAQMVDRQSTASMDHDVFSRLTL